MGALTKVQIIELLEKNGNTRDLCVQYADAYLEYQQATENIDRNGTICADPRTNKPMENPYVKIRDKALLKLRGKGLCRVKSSGLW